MSTQVGSVHVAIGGDISGLTRSLGAASGKLKSAGTAMAKTGAVMTAGITLPLLAIGKSVMGVAADFESSMNVLSIAARSSGTSLEDLQAAAIAVGGDTRLVGISAAEAAEAMTDFYKAGLDTTDIFGDLNAYMEDGAELSGALAAAVSLQAASELDLARASDVVSIAMATFGLEAEDATRISDNFVRAADASVASVGELADAMVNVGPTAASFGWSMEDVNTALALLSQRGIKGAEAGTALKSMMTNIMRPTDKVTGMLKRLNIELYDQDENLRSLPEIVGQLETAYSGLTEAEQHMVTQTLAGTYGMKAMNTLLSEGTEGWSSMEAAIASAASAQEVAAVRTQGMNAAMETLKGVLETLMIQVGVPLIQNVLTPLVQKITGLAEAVSGADPKILQLGVVIAGVAAAAGPVLTIMGGLVTVAGLLVSPVGLIAAGVVALGVAFVNSQGGMEGARAKIGEIWGQLQILWAGLMEKVLPVIQSLQTLWETVFPMIQTITHTVIGDVAPFIQTLLGEAAQFVQDKFGTLIAWWTENFPLIQTTVETVLGFIQTAWDTVWPAIETALRVVWDGIKGIIDTDINLILGILETTMLLINGDWEGAWTTLKETASEYLEDVKGVVRGAIDTILGFFGTTYEDLKGIGQRMIQGLMDGLMGAKEQLMDKARGIAASLPMWMKKVLGIASPSKVMIRIGENTIKGLGQGLVKSYPKLKKTVTDMTQNITDEFNLLPDDTLGPRLGPSNPQTGTISDTYRADTKRTRTVSKLIGETIGKELIRNDAIPRSITAGFEDALGNGLGPRLGPANPSTGITTQTYGGALADALGNDLGPRLGPDNTGTITDTYAGEPSTGVSRARAIQPNGSPITITVSGNNLYATTPMELAKQLGNIIMQQLAAQGVYTGA